MKATHVIYGVCGGGYVVQVMAGSEIAQEYTAGNSASDSQCYRPPFSRGTLTMDQLIEAAKITANRMAEEHGVPGKVEEDEDLGTGLAAGLESD